MRCKSHTHDLRRHRSPQQQHHERRYLKSENTGLPLTELNALVSEARASIYVIIFDILDVVLLSSTYPALAILLSRNKSIST